MKWLLIVIVMAGIGFTAYTYRDVITSKYAEMRRDKARETAPATGAQSPPPPIGAPALATPGAALRGKHLAPEGTYYMTERVSASTPNGIVAINPADKVTLVKKLPGNRMRVTNGEAAVEINSSQATNDLDLAREIEKREFVAHGGKL